MNIFIYALTVLIVFIPFSAEAQMRMEQKRFDTNTVFNFSEYDPALALDASEDKNEITIAEYTNIYYKKCVEGNKSPDLDEATITQCGCTAATLSQIMSKKNMQDIFSYAPERDKLLGDLMRLAYIPCMRESVRNISFDSCIDTIAQRKRLKNPRHVCSCIGDKLGDYAVAQGTSLLPNFHNVTFSPLNSPDNPLAALLQSHVFQKKERHIIKRCLLNFEL